MKYYNSNVFNFRSLSIVSLVICVISQLTCSKDFDIFDRSWRRFYNYTYFPKGLRLEMLAKAKEMFYFGYDNYMKYAFPLDELNPLLCSGRGPDYNNSYNININDVLGDYCLTLVDVLDTLAVIGNFTEFKKAVSLVVDNVNFDRGNTVQVFEANIRVVGALLSAHLLIVDPLEPFGPLKPDWYDNELLSMAHDLASRFLPAFETSKTGIPFPRVNLESGIPEKPKLTETCPAGAGSLILEMGILSRLLGDPIYEIYARRALDAIWQRRSKRTGLVGNAIDALTGKWTGNWSGLGAGMDSYYEYMLKAYILFGNLEDYNKFHKSYRSIKKYLRIKNGNCNSDASYHPLFVNVNMEFGNVASTWVDSLQASFAGLQVLHGDINDAICSHLFYYLLWKKYGVLPERFDWKYVEPQTSFYPLRPELIESTYLLYQATKNPFYLHVGKDILSNLNKYTRTKCGFATVHSVHDKSLEDRMESFFLSETLKYLILLFDEENVLNQNTANYIFSTEGHIFSVDGKMRRDHLDLFHNNVPVSLSSLGIKEPVCKNYGRAQAYEFLFKSETWDQLHDALEIDN